MNTKSAHQNLSYNKESINLIESSAKDFSLQYIQPYVMDWDESQHFPKEVLNKAGEYGFMGMLVPEIYGGSGFGYHEYVASIVEISKIDPSIGLSVAAHNSLCTNHILKFGNEDQKSKWLPNLASGKHIGAWGLTEPNTGSDASKMASTATKKGSKWVLNGTKNFITHGKSGDVAVVIFRTGPVGEKNNSTAFVIERGTRGFEAGKKENKLGMRASETAEMIFQDCIIDDSNRLGEVGEGFKQSMKILDGGRISIAALSLGIAKGAYEASLKYSNERIQFGKPISSFQAISFKLADMATEIQAAELLIRNASDKINNLEPMTLESAMCKLFTSELCVKVSNEAVQIFGGYGYIKDFPVEKYLRDSKLCTIGEGTSEIQKLVISRKILSK
ncbi:MAG: acyl-CoA dehydrogenase family protein [Flavobacteriaceae bacterium]|jgi:alkylation response protein AidB-like acyl-CoA dehydrogenase|tara:strand:+ start:1624 stop:2790 length:1167 start_codon:yes stop_codon:yes gene_type:complete